MCILKASLTTNNTNLYSKAINETMYLSKKLELEKTSLYDTYKLMKYMTLTLLILFISFSVICCFLYAFNLEFISIIISSIIFMVFSLYILYFIPINIQNLYDKQALQILQNDICIETYNTVGNFLTSNVDSLNELINLLKSPKTLIVVTNLINIVADSKLWSKMPKTFDDFIKTLYQAQNLVDNNEELISFVQQFDFSTLVNIMNTLNDIIVTNNSNSTNIIDSINNITTNNTSSIKSRLSNRSINDINNIQFISNNTQQSLDTLNNQPSIINSNASTFQSLYNNIQQFNTLYENIDLSEFIKLLNNKDILDIVQKLQDIINKISDMNILFNNWSDMQTWITHISDLPLIIQNKNILLSSIDSVGDFVTSTINNNISNIVDINTSNVSNLSYRSALSNNTNASNITSNNTNVSNIASNNTNVSNTAINNIDTSQIIMTLSEFTKKAISKISNENIQIIQTIKNILPLDYALFQRLLVYINLIAKSGYITNSFQNIWNLTQNLQPLIVNNINTLINSNLFTYYYNEANEIIIPIINSSGDIEIPAQTTVIQYTLNNINMNTFNNITLNNIYDATKNILNNEILQNRLQYIQNLYNLYNNIKQLNIFTNVSDIINFIKNIICITYKNPNKIQYYFNILNTNNNIAKVKDFAYSLNTTNNIYQYLYILNSI